jgi:Tfp pilus assembly protein PilZ
MDFRPLQLKAKVQFSGHENADELEWFEAGETTLFLAPLLTALEREEGKLRFLLPASYELNHITNELELPVIVERSELSGLTLRIDSRESTLLKQWGDLLTYLDDALGALSRLHPRYIIAELEIPATLNIDGDGGSPIDAKLFDISAGGVCLTTTSEIPLGQKVQLGLQFPDSWRQEAQLPPTITCEAVVKSVKPRGVGVEYSADPTFRKFIELVLKQVLDYRSQQFHHPRYDIGEFSIQCTLSFESGGPETVLLKDVSQSGCRVLTVRNVGLGERITVAIGPLERFKNLGTPITLPARAIRLGPDGFAVTFENVPESEHQRLADWIKEVASHFQTAVPAEAAEAAQEKADDTSTLTIRHSDLLAVRDYLYNLNPGGLFLPGGALQNKGDLVRISFDLSHSKLESDTRHPRVYVGQVVRKTKLGIGVQFVDPDKVRKLLEEVYGTTFRKPSVGSKALRTPQVAAKAAKEKAKKYISYPALIALSIVSVAVSLIFMTNTANEPNTAAEGEKPAVPIKTSGDSAPLPPGTKLLKANGQTYRIQISRVIDVSVDQNRNVWVEMDDGTKVPGATLLPYLPQKLIQKIVLSVREMDKTTTTGH